MTLRWAMTLTVLIGSTVLIYSSLYAARVQPEQRHLALVAARLGLCLFLLSGGTAASRLLEPGVALTLVLALAGTSSALLLADAANRLFVWFRRNPGTATRS